MRTRLRFFSIFIILFATMFTNQSMANGPKFKTPDFAYPQNVIKDARALLAKAQSMPESLDADITRIRAIIELCTAEQAIDLDTAFTQPAFIEKQLEDAKLTDAGRALLTCYQAKLYNDIYKRSSWKYNQVDAPLKPYPADVSEWSGLQFRTRISDLLAKAQSLAGNTPLSKFSDVLDYSPEALDYIPTLADFVRLSRFTTLASFVNYGQPELNKEIDAICNEAVDASAEATAPWFYWSTKQIIRKSDRKSRYSQLSALYSRYTSVEAARYVLRQICDNIGGDYYYYEEPVDGYDDELAKRQAETERRHDRLIADIRSSLQTFPKWYGNNDLKNRLNSLTQAKASFSMQSKAGTGEKIAIDIRYSFAKKITLSIHRLPSASTDIRNSAAAKRLPKVFSIDIIPSEKRGKATEHFTTDVPGYYAAIISVDGVVADGYVRQFMVTPFDAFLVNGCSKAAAIVTDYTSGKPLKGVSTLLVTDSRTKANSKKLGKTDSNGTLVFKAPVSDGRYYSRYLNFQYQGQTYGFNNNLRVETFNDNQEETDARIIHILSDRAIYHPGDTIEWAAVLALKKTGKKHGKAENGVPVTVKLFDANYELVDSVSAATDSYGRVYGSFATKKGGLTGSYYIEVESEDEDSTLPIMVSDFKAPTIETEVKSVQRDVPQPGAVTIEGIAKTYSGMPVAKANVAVTLQGASRWRWFVPQTTLTTMNVITGSDGSYTIVFPADVLAKPLNNGQPYTDFVAQITVTSLTAETAETSKSFTTGKPYSLAVTVPVMADSDKPVPMTVKAFDANGLEKPIAVKWQLCDKAGTAGLPSGTVTSGTPVKLDFSTIASGDYFIKAVAADTTLADAAPEAKLQLYSLRHNTLPQSIKGFFMPEAKTKVKNGIAEVLIGTNADKFYLYAISAKEDSLLDIKLHELGRGFSKVKVKLPKELDGVKLTLAASLMGHTYEQTVVLEQDKTEKTEIVAESFRNRLTPGAGETWRFRLAKGGKTLTDAAMIATMYDHALDALANGRWPQGFAFWELHTQMSISTAYFYNISESASVPFNYLKTTNIEWPAFIFGNGIYDLRIRGSRMMLKAAATASVETEEAFSEDSAEEEFSNYSSKALYGARTNYKLQEVVAKGVESADRADDNGDATKEQYREAEVLQAFWKPALTSDKNGNIDIVFTVPNANTTWQFKAFGWTKELDAAYYAAQALANKPVMVQPNLPRFLRQGDTATLLATVFNNSDETETVNTTVEIFSIESGKTVSTATFTDTIAPQASAIVSIKALAPTSEAAIGYRVRAVAGQFADGEQAAIPVLASASTVIESTKFYLNPDDSKPFELTVDGKNSELTLQYCQNPIWTIVRAMRGIAAGESLTATATVSHLFSALAAKHITDTNPDIAEAIRKWHDNPSESALTSMLSRNETLKKLMLDQTPWVQAAKSNTARMEALATLLEPGRSSQAIADTKAALAKFQNADGGFAWGGWSKESSVWSTEVVLTTLGIANSLGMLGKDFDEMLQPAFTYLQKQAAKPDMPKTDSDLALIATFFPEYKQTVDGSRIIRNTVAETARSWKADNITTKAYDVLILAGNGRRAEAAKVLESIRQFGVVQPGMGLCFPNVGDTRTYATIIQAFAAMDAPKAEIDAMRQWVTVQAQALDNIGAYNPDYIIASVMLTGSDWASVPVKQNVTVNGKALEITDSESATGYFAQTINADGKVKIQVTPNGTTPSYGSVISISRKPMTSVKARPGRDLSIEKRCLVERDGKWVETDRFALGERVRVQLTVKAKRNLQYVSIDDERPAAFAPVDQLPGYVWDGSLGFYRENLDASTRLFINYLPQGTYHISYDMTAAAQGSFISGIATLQSQYAPELTAHSAGNTITVE